MNHLCPKCRTATLAALPTPRAQKRSAEAAAVPPARCSTCHGVWMPHGALGMEGGVPEALEAAAPAGAWSAADAKVGFCPGGHGLLIRARVETERPFYLDRCGTCGGVFFDEGEWAALAASEWLQHLDDLWDPVFRRRMREERSRSQHIEALQQALGREAAQQVIDLAAALKDHPMQSLAVAFLLEELRAHEQVRAAPEKAVQG